jgi:hypothetical protein
LAAVRADMVATVTEANAFETVLQGDPQKGWRSMAE